jgi:hypothetical protein
MQAERFLMVCLLGKGQEASVFGKRAKDKQELCQSGFQPFAPLA